MVDVSHHGDNWWTRQQVFFCVVFFVVFKELGQQFGFALFAWVNETNLSAKLSGKEFNHVVCQ